MERKTYLFTTNTYTKSKKYWIIDDYVQDIRVKANTVKDAIKQYVSKVWDEYYINISQTAIKNKTPMYIDENKGTPEHRVVQTGYVITGSTEIDDTKTYVELWVTVQEVKIPDFARIKGIDLH